MAKTPEKKPEKSAAPPPVFLDAQNAPEQYPCWRYSKAAIVLVQNSAEEQALGEGFYDSPAKVPE